MSCHLSGRCLESDFDDNRTLSYRAFHPVSLAPRPAQLGGHTLIPQYTPRVVVGGAFGLATVDGTSHPRLSGIL